VLRHVKNVQASFALVFTRPSYVGIAGVLAGAAFLLAIWFPNLELIGEVWGSGARLAVRLGIIFSLLGGIATNFSVLTGSYTVAIALLFGITSAMIVYLLTRKRTAVTGQDIALGAGGVASGVIGVGCAACGSLVVNALLPSIGAAGALAALPLGGEEFGVLSVALLLLSLVLISKKISESTACSVRREDRGERSDAGIGEKEP